MLTKDEATRIADAVSCLRPDWSVAQLLAVLGDERLRMRRTYRDAAIAFTALAVDPATRQPTRIFEHGPWWEATRPTGSPSASAFIVPPTSDDCDVCNLPREAPHIDHEYTPRDSSGFGTPLSEPKRVALEEQMAATKLTMTAAPDPDTLCDVCNQTPERHTATAFADHKWRHA